MARALQTSVFEVKPGANPTLPKRSGCKMNQRHLDFLHVPPAV